MKFFTHLQKSYRSLLLHRLRSLLSTLGILFGVTAVIAMLSIGEGARQETLNQIEQLGIDNIIIRQIEQSEEQRLKATEKRSKGLNPDDVTVLANNLGSVIQFISPEKVIEAEVFGTPKDLSPEVLAITKEFALIKNLSLKEGRFISDIDINRKSLVCVIGSEISQSLGKNGHVGQTIRIEGHQFQIVGVLNPRHWTNGKTPALTSRNVNQCVLIPLGSHKGINRASFFSHTLLSEINVQIKHGYDIKKVAKGIQRSLDISHRHVKDYQVVIPQELMDQMGKAQKTFNLVLGSIAAISLLVGGIGIMNIMLATVSERTREIGIRRALGANQVHILLQFLSETLLLTLTGALLGIFFGILFSFSISYLAGWNTIVTWWSILLSMGMSSVAGLISGLYPAIKASKMDPIKALRYE